MDRYSHEDAAERAGVEPSYLVRLVELGILAPEEPDRFSPGDVRRVLMAKSLEDAGVPLEGVADALRRGALSLDFLDAASFERFAALAAETFQQVSDRSAGHLWLHESGGVRPRPTRPRSPLRLLLAEREEISRGLAKGVTLTAIAAQLGHDQAV